MHVNSLLSVKHAIAVLEYFVMPQLQTIIHSSFYPMQC